MSKDFDTYARLSAAIDLAAAAAQTAGASAARIRGRKRTVRNRIAVSAVSAVLVAAGATAAFKLSSSHGGTPQLTTASSRVIGSASPQATATTSPQVTATAGPSSGAPSPATSDSPSSSPAITADPHQAVQGAWLTTAQLPFGDKLQWKAMQASQGAGPIGQPLTATVFYMAKDTSLQALTACADPTSLLGRTTGAQHADYNAVQGSGDNATQFVFFFADATSAQQAFTWLQSQYSPSCRTDSGMKVTKTAGDGQTSAAWLIVTGNAAPVDAPAYAREYFVLRGSTIAYISVSAAANKLPMAYDDAGQLSTIAAHLCVYGGPCH